MSGNMHQAIADRAEGYAVVRNGKIDIRTVSPTRRAAVVNDLVVNCECPVFDKTTDDQIEDLWQEHRGEGVVLKIEVMPRRFGTHSGKAC